MRHRLLPGEQKRGGPYKMDHWTRKYFTETVLITELVENATQKLLKIIPFD